MPAQGWSPVDAASSSTADFRESVQRTVSIRDGHDGSRFRRGSSMGRNKSEDGHHLFPKGSFKERDSRHDNKDPDELISIFDGKLAEINAMLSKYKDEIVKPRDLLKGYSRASLSSSENKRNKDRIMTEDEFYKNSKIHRRAQSAGPGASRALSEKLDVYRHNPIARAELAERAKTHLRCKSEMDNIARASFFAGVNFIETNKAVLHIPPGPLACQLLDAVPHLTIAADGASAAASCVDAISEEDTPSWALTLGGSRPGSAALLHSSHMHGSARRSCALMSSRRSTLGTLRATSWPSQNVGDPLSTRPSSAVESNKLHSSSRPGSSNDYHEELSAYPTRNSEARSGNMQYDAWHTTPQKASGVERSKQHCRDRINSACSSFSIASLPQGHIGIGRALRIALSGRPASGGSPSRREEFIAEKKFISLQRQEHAVVVRTRHEEREVERQVQKELIADKKDKKHDEELRRREEERAMLELQERHRVWLGIINLSHKLWFIQECLKEDRCSRPLRELRREAAVKIATWYKSILLRRRQQELVNLITRVKRVLRPHLVSKREAIMCNCATRIIHFLAHSEVHHANLANVAVKRFLDSVRVIQERWRIMIAVRKCQQAVLYNWFYKFERQLVRNNSKAFQQELPMGGMMMSRAANVSMRSFPHGIGLQSSARRPSAKGPSSRDAGSRAHQHGAGPSSPREREGGGRSPPSRQASVTGAFKARKAIEIEDRELDAELSFHVQMLPKDIRQKIVDDTLTAERKHFYQLLDKYRADKKIFLAQKPMEDLRIKLLREAGLDPDEQLKMPIRPRMHVLLPRSKLKYLIRQGMQMLEQQRLEAGAMQREDEEVQALLSSATGVEACNQQTNQAPPSPKQRVHNASPPMSPRRAQKHG